VDAVGPDAVMGSSPGYQNEEKIMKTLLATLCLVAACVPASAQSYGANSRMNATGMSCGEIQTRIRDQGAVVLRFPSSKDGSRMMFGRYVSGAQYCSADEMVAAASVPTSDNKSCPVHMCVDER
jgi:hypothetical protein